MSASIDAIVARALESHPTTTDPSALSPVLRRALERDAERNGRTPTQQLAAVAAENAAAVAKDTEAGRLAREILRRGY